MGAVTQRLKHAAEADRLASTLGERIGGGEAARVGVINVAEASHLLPGHELTTIAEP